MAKEEIGSEFFEVPLGECSNNHFPSSTVWYRSGRTALGAIIDCILSRREFHSIALPSWCCETMIEPFLARKIDVFFYPVVLDVEGHLCQKLPDPELCDGILVMDYFGYVRQPELSAKWKIVIRDVTHSVFSAVYKDADYTYGSLRKWAGFWTGGFAWAKEATLPQVASRDIEDAYVLLRKQGMEEKRRYLSGEIEEKKHLKTFALAEDLLEKQPEGGADCQDIQAALRLNVPLIREKRRNNAAQLLDTIKEFAFFPELRPDDCPLFVPVRVPGGERDALRQYLIKQKIYCPVHWPVSSLHRLDENERQIYQEELSLVCDQRYDSDDMWRLCEAVDYFLKGNR